MYVCGLRPAIDYYFEILVFSFVALNPLNGAFPSFWCLKQCSETMKFADRNAPRPPVHRHVLERVAASLTVPQQACARRASKALWEAVTAASMEDMLRATVLEHRDTSADGAQLVVVAVSRALGPFPSVDALVAWCGGLPLLYEEVQLRFPHAAAIGVSARLAAIRPFPFASGSAVMTVCVVTAVVSAPSTLVVESVALGVRNATSVLINALSHDGSPCPILCLEGATREQFPNMLHDVLLSSLPSMRSIGASAFNNCTSLRSAFLADLPLLESIDERAFVGCVNLSSVDLSSLPSFRTIGKNAFWKCKSLQSISFADLPLLESIGNGAFGECLHLSSAVLSFRCQSPIRSIGKYAFYKCELQFVDFAQLPLLESIGEFAFADCVNLSSVDFSNLLALRTVGEHAFWKCRSLQSISFVNLPLLDGIGDGAFARCARLSSVDFSSLPSFRTIGACAFQRCVSLQSISFVSLPLFESIGERAFAGCVNLSSADLSCLPSFRAIEAYAFSGCESLQSLSFASLPLLQCTGEGAFDECVLLSSEDLSRLWSLCKHGAVN